MEMGKTEAATTVIKARKDSGGGFSAWMKSSCEFCSWADMGTTVDAQAVMGGELGVQRLWQPCRLEVRLETAQEHKKGLQLSDSLLWSPGFISSGSYCLQLTHRDQCKRGSHPLDSLRRHRGSMGQLIRLGPSVAVRLLMMLYPQTLPRPEQF